MDSQDGQELASGLSELAIDAWRDDALRSRLESEPRRVLGERGILIPEGVEVAVRFVSTQAASDEQARKLAREVAHEPGKTVRGLAEDWARGIAAGRLELILPEQRVAGDGLAEVSDQELETVAGGLWGRAAASRVMVVSEGIRA